MDEGLTDAATHIVYCTAPVRTAGPAPDGSEVIRERAAGGARMDDFA